MLRPKIVVYEIRDGSDEENVASQSEVGRVNAGNSGLSSDCPEKTLTKIGLSDLEVMARAKAGELGPGSHVVTNDEMVRVPTVGSSGGLADVGAEQNIILAHLRKVY